MKGVRRRIVLIFFLIVSQIAGLGVLAGALWLIEVKDLAVGKLALSGRGGQTAGVEIILPGRQAMGLTNGSILFGDTTAGGIGVRVLRESQDEDRTKIEADLLPDSSALLATLRSAGTMEVSVWVRQRRALAVLLESGKLDATRIGPGAN